MAQNWAFVSSGSVATGTTTVTVGVPSSYSAGNTLIIIASQTGGAGGPSTPSGWSAAASTTHFGVFYKTATASETSVSVTSGGSSASGVMLCYSNLGAFDAASTESTATSATTLATNTLTTTGADDLVISAWTTNGTATSWTAPGSTTQRASSLTTPALLVVDEDQAASGASTARTATTAPSTSLRAVAVAFKNGTALATGKMLLMF